VFSEKEKNLYAEEKRLGIRRKKITSQRRKGRPRWGKKKGSLLGRKSNGGNAVEVDWGAGVKKRENSPVKGRGRCFQIGPLAETKGKNHKKTEQE